MGLLTYYFLIIVIFLALILYDLLFYVNYKTDQCPAIVPILADSGTATNTTDTTNSTTTNTTDTTNSTTTNTTDTTATTTTDPTYVTNNLVIIPLFIIILYGGIIVLCLLAMLGIYCFSGMSSERFGNLNWFWGCCGLYVRNFEFLTRILSIVGFLFIGVQAALTFFGEECKEAVHEYTVNRLIYQDVGAMYRASIILVFVNLGFWGATHCLLPLLKLFMDSEAFLYEPYNREKSTAYYVCCGVCGP